MEFIEAPAFRGATFPTTWLMTSTASYKRRLRRTRNSAMSYPGREDSGKFAGETLAGAKAEEAACASFTITFQRTDRYG